SAVCSPGGGGGFPAQKPRPPRPAPGPPRKNPNKPIKNHKKNKQKIFTNIKAKYNFKKKTLPPKKINFKKTRSPNK
ncbi:hypothetical protein ACVGWR_18000, partial [Enterobacter hormaechei]